MDVCKNGHLSNMGFKMYLVLGFVFYGSKIVKNTRPGPLGTIVIDYFFILGLLKIFIKSRFSSILVHFPLEILCKPKFDEFLP